MSLEVVTGASLIVFAQRAQGWDGLGYFILAAFIALPALLGTIAGFLIARLLRVRSAPPHS
jgi:hypothetical protein